MRLKRIVALLLSIAIVFSINACKKNSNDVIDTSETLVEETTETTLEDETSEEEDETLETEESEDVDVEEAEETEETEESDETVETEITQEAIEATQTSTPTPTNAPAPTSTPVPTSAPAPTVAPTAPQSNSPSNTPTNFSYNGNSVGTYNVDGYGTVYGYYTASTSFVLSGMNDLRSEVGAAPLTTGNQTAADTRAVEVAVNFSHTRPNGQDILSVGVYAEIITTNTWDPISAYRGSQPHYEIMINPSLASMASATFVALRWVPAANADGGYWEPCGSANVCVFNY